MIPEEDYTIVVLIAGLYEQPFTPKRRSHEIAVDWRMPGMRSVKHTADREAEKRDDDEQGVECPSLCCSEIFLNQFARV